MPAPPETIKVPDPFDVVCCAELSNNCPTSIELTEPFLFQTPSPAFH